MKRTILMFAAGLFALALSIGSKGLPPSSAGSPAQAVKQVIAQQMPQVDGKNLTATMIEVTYPPGGSSPAHSHPCPVIGYVLEGAIESQVKGQPAAIYTAGQTFYEPPNGVHAVSRNASKDKEARLLAYFLCDHAGPLTVLPPAVPKQGTQ